MSQNRHSHDLEHLPVRAKGVFDECVWEYRADVVGDSALEWIDIRSPYGAGGGGGAGALPFADVGYKVLGHIGSWGVGSGQSRKGLFRKHYRPSTVSGVVSSDVASVVARFANGAELQTQLLDIGRDDVRFFVLLHDRTLRLAEIAAFGAAGQEIERVSLEVM
jgi:hypothetical protein